MCDPGEFVSVFRKNGRAILPPVMNPMRRAEMQEYKLKALAVEKKLLERRMMNEETKIKSGVYQNETFTEQRDGSGNDAFLTAAKSSDSERYNEEDKENEDFDSGRKSVDALTCVAKAVKYPLSERTVIHSNSSDSELHSISSKESTIFVNQQEDEACSVAPTDSTDLQQYLDSTLGDVSPEARSNFDHSENTHIVGNDQAVEEDHFRVNALLMLDSKLAAMRFSPLVDLSKEIPMLILQGKSDSFSCTTGEKKSEKADIVVNNPDFQDKMECISVHCSTSTSIPDAEAKEVGPPFVPDSNLKQISYAAACNSEMKTVPLKFEDNHPQSTPLLVRRGSYTLDSPSPTLLANIHKYSVDDLPKSGIHSKESIDVGKGKTVQVNEKTTSKNVTQNMETYKRAGESRLESARKSKISKSARNGGSVFERLAADAAKKAEARRKSVKEGTFKVPDIKKVPKSVKGLRSAISINNIRASLSEAHKKSLSAARRCNSDVNIPYAVVKAVSTNSHPAALTRSQKKHKSVDINEAPPHLRKMQNGAQVDAVAAQKRKRRRWAERWEGWNKVIEPIHRNLTISRAPVEGDKVSAVVENSESSSETKSPKLNADKSFSTQCDDLTDVKEVEKEIDLCQNISGEEHVNENNLMLVNGKKLGCNAENIPVKDKKECDNLLIAKQSSQAMHSSAVIQGMAANGDVDSLNDSHTESNVAPRICEERNVCLVPEIHQEVALDKQLEPRSAITESVCVTDTFDSPLQGSPERSHLNVDEPSSTQRIPLDLQRTIESLPETPIGQHSAKNMALNILSRVIEEQDKALQNLLAENRRKEEDIREKFQEQLRYLVGKLTRLVQAMPSPSINGGSVVMTQKSLSEDNCISGNKDVCLSSPSSISKVGMLSKENIKCEKCCKANSTLHHREKEESKYNPLTSPIPELLNSLPQSNYNDVISTTEVQDKTSCTNGSPDDTPKRSPVVEDITNVTCTLGLKSLTPKSCSRNTSVHSSPVKDDLKTIKVFSKSEKSDSAEYVSRERDATSTSPVSEQLVSQNMSKKEFSDSNSEVSFHDLKSSTAIEGCKTQNVDLDLSGILEMEFQGKNISHLPLQLVPSNPLHETCSSSLSSVPDSKLQMNYGFLIDELALRRKKYEDDVSRLDVAESTPRGPSKLFIDSITPFSAKKDDGQGECQILAKKSPSEHMKELGIKTLMVSELPDLKCDVTALHSYLGVEMPSTGPVTLEAPVLTSACLLEEAQDSEIVNQIQLAARQSRCFKSRFLSPKQNEENNKTDLVCDPVALLPPIRSSTGRTVESLSDANYLTPESSSSSVNYISAMSGSLACNSVVNDLEKKKIESKLGALIRGYLTRRLLKTTRVLGIKAMIQDSIETALKLHSEVSEEKDVSAADVLLHGRILAQLSAAYNELHHIFFELPVKERMAIINNDRKRLLSRNSTPVMYDAVVADSPRPALLSAVTLKTLQRRFGDKVSAKKEVPVMPTKKRECTKLKEKSSVTIKSKVNSRKLVENHQYQKPTRAKSFTTSAKLQVKGKAEVDKNTVGEAARKTENVNDQPKSYRKKPRRSSSTGEISRRPWR